MAKVTIQITIEEGVILYMGTHKDGSANWRMLNSDGKTTRPMPRRLFRKRRDHGEA